MAIKPLKISSYTLTNALGTGLQASLTALQSERSGLSTCDFDECDLSTYIGRVDGLEQVKMPAQLQEYSCRNNKLTLLGLEQDAFVEQVHQASERYGAHRVGVFLGTSTSGIQETELAFRNMEPQTQNLPNDYHYLETHNVFSLVNFTQRYLNLKGPAHAVSTACSSSSKVFASAWRHIQSGYCDAAVVGGVDSLCLTTLYGFNSLQLVSEQPCRPWDAQRNGINIGEGAGFALLEPAAEGEACLAMLGYGESSDAYHMSTPHPEGRGAIQAMQQALNTAGLNPDAIDYINLHGTATRSNDSAEDKAVVSVFGKKTPCSSTKGWTGHTLGAAGITEAVFGCLAIEHDFMPISLNTEEIDPDTSANIVQQSQYTNVKTILSNSFGFGGSNCSLVIGRTE